MDIRLLGDLGDVAKLGQTLSEAKQILARLHQAVVTIQADDHPVSVRIARLAVMSCVSRQGLAASSDGDADWHCAGAPPAVSWRRLWRCCIDRRVRRSNPSPFRTHLIRTEIGRPSSRMRFKT
jgi:hypothetical protein